MRSLPSFPAFFRALWEPHDPFPWQTMLAERIADGHWPQALDLPTAAGKTACIDAAIYALASQAERPLAARTAPRRIWFVVDRRIVVDEAFDRASEIAAKLEEATKGPIKEIADRLRQVSGTKRPLAVARLRGGILRDDGWARLPSQPAVITTTVDQLGSRLLFRGYGPSHLAASIFAGLASHDSLILLDEAHCSIPFLQTLRSIENYRGEAWAESPIHTPFAFAILSATLPPGMPEVAVFPGIDRKRALDHPVLNQRLSASKPAELVTVTVGKGVKDDDPLIAEAAERASAYVTKDGRQRVAVIVNRVRTAREIARMLREPAKEKLHKAEEGGDNEEDDGRILRERAEEKFDVVLLTGRIRPHERDRLVERWKPVLRASSPNAPERPVILVSTQCIEVGADFSFDALVTEAASLDALRQRFGRLNRMGLPGATPAAILIRGPDAEDGEADPIYGTAIVECWRLLNKKAEATRKEKEKEKLRVVDFGFAALEDCIADEEDLSPYLAPRPDAPVLLPAHLDLLCQTAPTPRPEPEVQLFLHGVDRGAPEARVVWRADLSENDPQTWKETVALCPPNSGEILSVPLYRLRAWLAQIDTGNKVLDDEAFDVEGSASPKQDAGGSEEEFGRKFHPALLWRGRDRSKVCRRAAEIKPNELVILPAAYGISGVGQSVPVEAMGEKELDLWEPSRCASGRPPALRLHRAVLRRPWLRCPPLKDLLVVAEDPAWDRETLREAIDAVIVYQPANDDEPPAAPDWLLDLLRAVRGGRVVDHPAGGLVMWAHDPAPGNTVEPDLFADDDDLLSAGDQEISLARHTESVVRAVAKMSRSCLAADFVDPLSLAAHWHDVGKLDQRFQLLLQQGDELATVSGEPLAKSRFVPTSPSRRSAIRDASGLPANFRHEMLSLQLTERHAALPDNRETVDLVLHLVASHHGHARPFAPIAHDPEPVAVSGSYDGADIELAAADRARLIAPYSLGSLVPERFWQLTRRYGWWGLAYLEAVLRLADWYGSRWVAGNGPPTESAPGAKRTRGRRARENPPDANMILSGIDGANPLGFLAAVGALLVLPRDAYPEARLSWKRSATWQPALSGIPANEQQELCEALALALRGALVTEENEKERQGAEEASEAAKREVRVKRDEISKKRGLNREKRKAAIELEVAPLQQTADEKRTKWLKALKASVSRPELAIGKRIDCTPDEYREHASSFLDGASFASREPVDLLAAFASDACVGKSGRVVGTPFCFITGSGHQYFLDTVRQLMELVTPERIRSVLLEPWTYADEKLSMRWDPMEDRRYALMDRDPTAADNKSRTVWMANLLAYRAIALFPSVPRGRSLATTSWNRYGDSNTSFCWPIWVQPAGLETIRSLLSLRELTEPTPDRSELRSRGIVEVFRAQRIKVGAGANFKINFSPARSV